MNLIARARKWKLRTRLAITFSFLLLLCLGGVTWISMAAVTRTFKTEAVRSLHVGIDRLASELEALERSADRKVAAIAAEADLSRLIGAIERGTWSPDDGQVVTWAQETMRANSLTLLELVDPEGVILSSGHWPGSAGGSATAWGSENGGGSLRVSSLRDGRSLAIVSSRRIEGRRGGYRISGGHLFDAATLDQLASISGGPVGIVSADPAFEPRLSEGWDVNAGRDLYAVSREYVVGSMTGGESGLVIDPEAVPGTSEGRLVCGVGVFDDSGVELGRIVFARSVEPIENLRFEIARATVAAAVVGLLVSWLGAVLLAARITRPLVRLTEGARRVSSGDLDTTVPERGGAEVRALARSFNRMTRDLKESRRDLVRAERIATWRDIARRIAHEIKNALSPIRLSTENIRKAYGAGHPEFGRIIEEATRSVLHEVDGLNRMVGEFSEFARMPAITLRSYDLHQILTRAARAACGDRGCALDLEAEPSSGTGDGDLLYRAFTNLIKNGRESMEEAGTWEGDRPLQVTSARVSAQDLGEGTERGNGDFFVVTIRDFGLGLSGKEIDKIFTPYFTTKKSGTGLGLPMVHRIVTEHGGRVIVRSPGRKGCLFEVRLPADAPSQPSPRQG